jgi:peptide/nickel transport system permease protein
MNFLRAVHAGYSRSPVGFCLLTGFVLLAVFAPWLSPHDPYVQDLALRLQPPWWSAGGSLDHPLGTDEFGRDFLSRLIFGARVSLAIALIVVVVSAPIGILLGLVGGYFGGRIDAFVMFVITTRLSLPVVLVVLAIVSMTGSSFTTSAIVLGLLFWDRFAIVSRAVAQQLRSRQFIVAARATGASHLRIMAREMLPNMTGQILAIATIEMAHAILVEAALSFLGLGVEPPTASWGLMVAQSRDLYFFQPHLVFLPGLAIFLLVFAINRLGDGVASTKVPT